MCGDAGPPENVRDHVMAATKALSSGDWNAAYDFLATLPVWGLIPNQEQVCLAETAISCLA